MASRNRKGSQMDNLEGKKIIVKYAEGDFHGKIVRKISGSKFIILWEGDSAEDVNPITLDPKKMGKQFKADQNGWEIVDDEPEPEKEKEPAPPPPPPPPRASVPSPVTTSGKRTTNPVKRSLSEGGVKIKLTGTFHESPTKPAAPAAKRTKSSPPLTLQEQLAYITLKLGLLKAEMKPVLSEADVKEFEEKEKISLPAEYRQFLLTVGNGGAGPLPDGLCQLGDRPKSADADAVESTLAKPWPLQMSDFPAAAECYLGVQSCYTKTAIEGDSREISAAEKAVAEKAQGTDGLLWLGPGQEGSNHYLVVSGEGKGDVWFFAADHLGPFTGGFMEWYLSWLDRQQIGCPINTPLSA